MHYLITKEMIDAQLAAQRWAMQAMFSEAEKKAKALAEWEKANPPCPHCGRRGEPPFWLRLPG